MKYIDRRLLFPVATVATVWAQQPADPAAAQAEAVLRSRVDEFYKLQVDKKFRQSESMVAEDSKDDYYNRAKQDIKGFSIDKIELLDNNTRAKVTLKSKVILRAPLMGAQVFDMPMIANWKIENGQWVWYIDRGTNGQTPFGRIIPGAEEAGKGDSTPPPVPGIDIKTLKNQVTVDRGSVTLNASQPEQAIMFTNHLPGPISLELTKPQLTDVSVELEKSDLKGGETSVLQFRLTGKAKSSGIVSVAAFPLNVTFEIQVHSN